MSNQQKARRAYTKAKAEGYALGAFNIDNQETLIAVCRALKAQNAPAMVEVSDGEVKAMGLSNIRDMVDNYRAEYGVEIYINLDHSPTVEAAQAGVDAGFEFIHIDISQAKRDATHEEIVKGTREVVSYAKRNGALVESEPHYFGGGSNVFREAIKYDDIRKWFTVPQEAMRFIEDTGIDTFAVAIGNLHGRYPVDKKLDIGLLKEIRHVVPDKVFLSLHGGSGTEEHYYKEAVTNGISKVNINSDLRYTFRTGLEEQLKDNPDEFAVVKLMEPVEEDLQKVVEKKLELFGAVGKAEP